MATYTCGAQGLLDSWFSAWFVGPQLLTGAANSFAECAGVVCIRVLGCQQVIVSKCAWRLYSHQTVVHYCTVRCLTSEAQQNDQLITEPELFGDAESKPPYRAMGVRIPGPCCTVCTKAKRGLPKAMLLVCRNVWCQCVRLITTYCHGSHPCSAPKNQDHTTGRTGPEPVQVHNPNQSDRGTLTTSSAAVCDLYNLKLHDKLPRSGQPSLRPCCSIPTTCHCTLGDGPAGTTAQHHRRPRRPKNFSRHSQ